MKIEMESKELDRLEETITWLESKYCLLQELFNNHTVLINKLEKEIKILRKKK